MGRRAGEGEARRLRCCCCCCWGWAGGAGGLCTAPAAASSQAAISQLGAAAGQNVAPQNVAPASPPASHSTHRVKVELEQGVDVAAGVHGISIHGVVAGLQHPQGHLPQPRVALLLRRRRERRADGGRWASQHTRFRCGYGCLLFMLPCPPPTPPPSSPRLHEYTTPPTCVHTPSGPVAPQIWGMPLSMVYG